MRPPPDATTVPQPSVPRPANCCCFCSLLVLGESLSP
jgi:hypothetical protein